MITAYLTMLSTKQGCHWYHFNALGKARPSSSRSADAPTLKISIPVLEKYEYTCDIFCYINKGKQEAPSLFVMDFWRDKIRSQW